MRALTYFGAATMLFETEIVSSDQSGPTELCLCFLANGNNPIPVVGPDYPGDSPGKRPPVKEWQESDITTDAIQVGKTSPPDLRPYQHEAVEAIRRAFQTYRRGV